MHAITPHLWFDREAKEAAQLYTRIIPGSKITNVTTLRGTPSGDTELVSFELSGQPFLAISAGPLFRFNPSVSFHVKFDTTEEVDAAWGELSRGGNALMPLGSYPFSERFGWIADRYGLSWQLIHAGGRPVEQRIVPVLMFVNEVCGKAEEAMRFYTDVFQGPAPEIFARYGKGSAPDREGTVQYGSFSLRGQEFGAMDSAREHAFGFNEAISFMVPCDTQREIDEVWEKLSADPGGGQCGWTKDRFGLSWQITPTAMSRMLGCGDSEKIGRVTRAFLQMKKFDLAELERAFAGK